MTDREDWWQSQNTQQGFGQQYPQEQPWQSQQYDPRGQSQQYDPRRHAQRLAQPAPRHAQGASYSQPGQTPPGPQQYHPEPPFNPAQSQPPQHAPRKRSPGLLYAGIALVIGVAIGGVGGYALHGSGPAAADAGDAGPSTAATGSAPATPDTSAAAKAAAAQFLALYSAGQWAPAWQYLTAADKAEAPLSVYEAVHNGCPSKAAGLAYKIQGMTMAGKTAVATYTVAGVASTLGSATLAETWTAEGWKVTGNDMGVYSHGSASADLASAKAAGDCAT